MNLFSRWTNIKLILLAIFLLLTCLYSAGQATTFAWLSNFPERANQLGELKIKYWAWLVIALISAAMELAVITQLIRRFLYSRKKSIK